MTELPEILSTHRYKEVSISNNFQSTSPAAAFGINWGSTAELILGVFGGIAPDGTEKADTTLTLTGSAVNYVEMTTAGVVSSNTSAYTSGRVKLFRMTTNADGVTSYIDDRSFSPGGLRFAGPSTDNAIARFDGTTGQLQNSVVTISDTGAIAGAISLSIAQGTITDPANAFTVTSTWNDAADTFIGSSIDITNTASAAASLIQRWRVGGVVMASISKLGAMVLAAGLTLGGQLAIASGTLTDSAPAVDITQTWNDATEAFVGASMNITRTASLTTSLLQRWQVDSVDVASVGLGQAGTNGVIAVHKATTTTASVVAFTAATTYPATAITTAEGFRSTPTMADGSGVTYAQVIGFKATNAVKSGAGDTITKQVGFSVGAAFNVGTSNYGFEGTIAVSGTTRYNVYMSGTAPNHFGGQVFVGNTVGVTVGQSNKVQISGDGSTAGGLSLSRYSADALGTRIEFSKSRNATIGSNTIANSLDVVANIIGYGANGTTYDPCAQMIMEIAGTPGASADMPGRFRFLTTPDGSATPLDRMWIDSDGAVQQYAAFTSATAYSRMALKFVSTTLASVSGATVTATNLIPAKARVIGVNTKVTVGIGTGGGTTGYQVGDGTDADRWGNVTGTTPATDTDGNDATADPGGYFNAANNVVITANGGNFNGIGSIRIDVFYTLTEAD